jgi:translation initiation factor 4A
MEEQIHTSFETMSLKNTLLRGIYAYGFEKPSGIQQRAIIPLINGKDLIAQSQSGTGKTGTFAISVLQSVDENIKSPQSIIIAPTRELAHQIYVVITALSSFMNLNIIEMIGGVSNQRQSRYDTKPQQTQQANASNAQIIVGTPGKILDEFIRGRISNKALKRIILDEADEMLSKGFFEQIDNIFSYIPKDAQIVLFSATMPKEVIELAEKIMHEPVKILIKNDELTLEGIRQYYVLVDREADKFDVLCDIYGTIQITQSIIYCNSRKKVSFLARKMKENNFMVSCIYGDMQQIERNEVMKQFRNGDIRVLITTDILSRGIDIQQVSLVINYELPLELETYIHRIGRSGRFGRKGVSINLVDNNEMKDMKQLQDFYSTHIEELPQNIADLL